jgi:hypothetical protein
MELFQTLNRRVATACTLAGVLSSAAIAVTARPPQVLPAPGLGLTAEQYDDLPDMPGSDFIMKGFDITNDSVSEYVSKGGETSRLPVYKYSYTQQNTYKNPYSGTVYRVPDQLSPTTNTEAMEYIVQDISFQFKEIMTYYTSRYNIDASITTKNISASVSYNHAMAKAETAMSNDSHVFAGSKKWWKVFDLAAYPPALVGCVDPMLSSVLSQLPAPIKSDEDRNKYEMLVKAWGTHYIINGNFGGKLIHNVYVDTAFYYSQSSSWISNQIALNFHFDAFAIDGGGFTNKSEININQNYSQHSSSSLFCEGGLTNLQTNETLAQWETTIAEAPHFLNCTLSKLSDLAQDSEIQKTLSSYIDLYLAKGGNFSKMSMTKLRAL